ncbi:GNAT family N-acetyltransferase [Streptomyces sp. BI20]|uniref:GNAT family N-acetyltransferase n=1 Tax=Streptomyces sp. BI20 TaxID=3403460 RepID=UPI003C72421F
MINGSLSVRVRELRTADRSDAEAAARIRSVTLPWLPTMADDVSFRLATAGDASGLRMWLAETEEGRAVGVASAELVEDSPTAGQARLSVDVLPEARGLGAGGALFAAAEEHLARLGARDLFVWVPDEAEPRAFAERRGFSPGRSASFLSLDLTTGTPADPGPPPPGVTLRPASDWAADPHPMFLLDAAVSADEPGDVEVEFADFAWWRTHVWNSPALDPELTLVVLVDGRPAAFTAGRIDGAGRYATGMTGTLAEFRGRGLARLAKTHALRLARGRGAHTALTGNDNGNAPMLAVNTSLGYAVASGETRFARRAEESA